jgi:2-keto-4-pentenoate hydratase/2-oxohepta-3-ene-1,7-dioic acid hydratase in catechol pathway
MKIVRYEALELARVGIVESEMILPLANDIGVRDLLRMSPDGRSRAIAALRTNENPIPISTAILLPPISDPVIRDFFNFESHAEGVYAVFGRSKVPERWYDEPVSYIQNPHTVIGAHQDVEIPPGCREFDFELEVGAVIGLPTANVHPALAEQHIAAYTIMNDWSARDVQIAATKAGRNETKAKDGATTLGPCLVTADELEPYRRDGQLDLKLIARVNGREIGTDTLSNMAWNFAELVAYSARGSLLGVGDVIASGTCGGGCLLELWGRSGEREPRPLRAGDVVTLAVEGIGVLENRVVDSPNNYIEIPTARRRHGV